MTIKIFNNLGTDLKSIQNRNDALIFIALTIGLNLVQHVTLIFPDERLFFVREVYNNILSFTAYFFANIGSEFPIIVLILLIYCSIVYFAILHLPWDPCLALPLSLKHALVMSSLLADKQLAVALTPLLVICLMLFAGFFIAKDVIPK